jgi:hypothetical protein
MALLLQHHPYTDPLEVLICGGSTLSGHYALDNCVSTQPEVANLVRTIERMVSVMLLDEADVMLTLFLVFQASYAAHGRAAWRYLYRHEQV